MNPSDHEASNAKQSNTGGGALVDGTVNAGGDFVGRDQTIHGDRVGRDKITIDSIQSTATAVGTGAIAQVTITEETAYNVHGLTNPYLGLRAFGYTDRAIYAGREQLAEETVQRLTAPGAQQTILFITGVSGSGKSSFAQAGLIPLLESLYATYQKTIRHAIFRPSSQPMVMLADALQKFHPDLTPATLTTNTPKDQINLLLIDQFEELFIQSDASERAPFCDFLTNLPSFADCRTHILITLRVDYLDELYAIQPLWAKFDQTKVDLRAMSADDLRNAIQKPLQVTHPQKRFAPELLERLVQDASKDAALLPLLQVTLAELWKTGKLVLSNYHSLTDAIRQRAELVYAFTDDTSADPKVQRLANDQQELMSILLDLINVAVDGTDRRDARQRRTRQALEQGSPHRPRLIEELVTARLLAAANETHNGAGVEVIDIIHESLIDNWAGLKQAIEKQRQQLQRRARFTLWLGEWRHNGKQDGYLLLTDIQLAEARALVEAQDIEVQGEEAQAFYRQSVEWQETERQKELQRARALAEAQRQRAQVFRNGVVVASLLFLLAAAAAIISYTLRGRLYQTNVQLQQLADVAFSRQLAAQSATELSQGRYELAILLALEAGQVTDTLEAYSVIRSTIANPGHGQIVFFGHTDYVLQASWNPDKSKIVTGGHDGTARIWDAITGQELHRLDGHARAVGQTSWNRDGTKILTGSDDGTVHIWDAATGQPLVSLDGHTGAIAHASWNGDGTKIFTSSADGTARIWDAATGKELLPLDGHTGQIKQASWNRDGTKILTSSYDGTARIWDVTSGREVVHFDDDDDDMGAVYQARWNRDESKILTSSGDGTARIWDAATGQGWRRFEGHARAVYQASWNSNETKVLTGDHDGTVRIWDADTEEELHRLEGHTGQITQARWNRDDTKILTSSYDGTVRIWNAVTGQELIRLGDHSGIVTQAQWSDDETKILTSSFDGTARIWSVTPGQELPSLVGRAAVKQASWNSDETMILTGSDDGAARIWHAITGQELHQLEGHTGQITQARWNSDDTKVLTGSADGTARIWDVITGQALRRFEGHTDQITQARWNRDETKLLTSSFDGTTQIWNAITGQALQRLDGQPEQKFTIADASWNSEGSKILTSSYDGTARIWDVITGQELVRFGGGMGSVYHAYWNGDETKILTSSYNGIDGTARIWKASTKQDLLLLAKHKTYVGQASWNHRETKLLTIPNDGTVHIWNAITGQELVRLDGHTDSVTQASWNANDTKLLTSSADGTARIWDASTGHELVRLDGHTDRVWQAMWSRDESKILTSSADGRVRIWYVQMKDLLKAGCHWAPRNFAWAEWNTYMEENTGAYRPTCPNAPIPPDAIEGIQAEARQQILAGQESSGTQRLEELNGWLQVNGQFKHYGVDVEAFVIGVSATATAEALPATTTPTAVAP